MKLFIWDFHGVLEKGNELAVIDISNKALEEFGYSATFTWDDCDKLYGLKWWEYFQYLLPDEPREKHIALQERCFEISDSTPEIVAKYIKPNDNAHQVLQAIKDKGHTQVLISNTQATALKMFLKVTGVDKFFDTSTALAVDAHRLDVLKTKKDILKDYIKDKSFEDFVIIGDSSSDIALSEIVGGKTYLYAHTSREFKDCDAYYKIRDLLEILKELE